MRLVIKMILETQETWNYTNFEGKKVNLTSSLITTVYNMPFQSTGTGIGVKYEKNEWIE